VIKCKVQTGGLFYNVLSLLLDAQTPVTAETVSRWLLVNAQTLDFVGQLHQQCAHRATMTVLDATGLPCCRISFRNWIEDAFL